MRHLNRLALLGLCALTTPHYADARPTSRWSLGGYENVVFRANPPIVEAGQSTQLFWAALGARSCRAADGWTGTKRPYGSFNTGPLNQTTTFRLACRTWSGWKSGRVTVVVNARAPEPQPIESAEEAAKEDLAQNTNQQQQQTEQPQQQQEAPEQRAEQPQQQSEAPQQTEEHQQQQQPEEQQQQQQRTEQPQQQREELQQQRPKPQPLPVTTKLAASSIEIIAGESVTLSWSGTNANSCSASGGWNGVMPAAGSYRTTPATTTMYSMTCSNPTSTDSETVRVEVKPKVDPEVTVSIRTANSEILAGESTQLSWSSTGATNCEASGDWQNARPLAYTQTVTPPTDQTYTLTCHNATHSASATARLAVRQPNIELSLNASRKSVAPGDAVELSWTATGADRCTAANGWQGGVAVSGKRTVNPEVTSDYSLTCTNADQTRTAEVRVAVNHPAPSVDLKVSPSTVDVGQPVTIEWNSEHTTSCDASGAWNGSKAVSGELVHANVTGPLSFSLTCRTPDNQTAVAMAGVEARNLLIRWAPPTQNTDGTPVVPLSEYRVYIGEQSGQYSRTEKISNPKQTSAKFAVTPGRYFVSMTAVSDAGVESERSREVALDIVRQ